MALPRSIPLDERVAYCHTASCAASPIAASTRAPCRGKIIKVWSILGGVITVADCSVAVDINGTAVTGGTITVANVGSAAGVFDSAEPTAANLVNEDDVIKFTPSGATGTAIPMQFGAVIQQF
jgi:hypothetical protein